MTKFTYFERWKIKLV